MKRWHAQYTFSLDDGDPVLEVRLRLPKSATLDHAARAIAELHAQIEAANMPEARSLVDIIRERNESASN